jgi:hypothetical protein
MTATTPLIIDGESYPYYSMNLAITSYYQAGDEKGNAALRLVPTRIDESGNAVTRDDYAVPVLLGDMTGLNEPERTTVGTIQQALQNFINLKNL